MRAEHAIYLDASAGIPASASLLVELSQITESSGTLGNPSSVHSFGRNAKRLLERARDQVAKSLGVADRSRIGFCSSGTEANQSVIRLAYAHAKARGVRSPLWMVGATTHSSVQNWIPQWRALGGSVEMLGVSRDGQYRWDSIGQPFDLLSFEWVNHETGVVQNLSKAKAARNSYAQEGWLHCDAVQAWGKIKLNDELEELDWVSFSGHKIGALAGVGLVLSSSELKAKAWGFSGSQEGSRRAGTENLIGIISMGLAASKMDDVYWERTVPAIGQTMRSLMIQITEAVPGARLHGDGVRGQNPCLIMNFGFEGIHSQGMIQWLDQNGICASSGSACSAGIEAPSPVLLAMGYTDGEARGALRLSAANVLTNGQIDKVVQCIKDGVKRLSI